MKFPTYIGIFLAALAIFASSVSAQPSSVPPSDEEATNNIKKRLVNNEITVPSEENILSTSPKAFVGTVQDIVQNNIAIATKDGQKFAIPTDDSIIIRSPGNKEIEAESIQIDDYIIAMGYLVSDTKLESSRIIVSQTLTSSLNKTTGRATVEEVDTNTITLSSDTNDTSSLSFTSATVFKDKDGVIDEDVIEPGSTIIYTAKINDDNELTATIIMLSSPLTSTEEAIE